MAQCRAGCPDKAHRITASILQSTHQNCRREEGRREQTDCGVRGQGKRTPRARYVARAPTDPKRLYEHYERMAQDARHNTDAVPRMCFQDQSRPSQFCTKTNLYSLRTRQVCVARGPHWGACLSLLHAKSLGMSDLQTLLWPSTVQGLVDVVLATCSGPRARARSRGSARPQLTAVHERGGAAPCFDAPAARLLTHAHARASPRAGQGPSHPTAPSHQHAMRFVRQRIPVDAKALVP